MSDIVNKKNIDKEDGEIDYIAIAQTLWQGRKLIIKSTIAFAIIGLLVAIFSPKQYTASMTVVPQTTDAKSGLGSLSGLAAMAGFNLNMNSGSNIAPSLYPQIMSSVSYQLELMNTPIQFENIKQPVTLFRYYIDLKKQSVFSLIKKYTVGLPGTIAKALRNNNDVDNISDSGYIKFTDDQKRISEILADQVTINVNDKDGYIVLSSEMPDAIAAAQLTRKAIQLLQQYITSFKIEKAQAQKDFIQLRFNEKKQEFDSIQEKLARFQDEHKNISSALTRIQESQLTSKYNMLSEVYTELAKQLEQAQIQVKEDTPIFTIIQPVTVPNEKSSPRRGLIMVIFVLLGGVIGMAIIYSKKMIYEVKRSWEEN